MIPELDKAKLEVTVVRLYQHIARENWSSICDSTWKFLDNKIKEVIPRPAPTSNGIWDIVSVTEFLHASRQLIEQMLIAQAQTYSRIRWLWYLRRLPNQIFEGSITSTHPYDLTLAEAVSSFSALKIKDFSTETNRVICGINGSIVRRLLRFCAGIIFLAQIHVILRYAGKSAEFTFTDAGLPDYTVSPEKLAAIRLYDARSASLGNVLARAGTRIATHNSNSDRFCLVVLPAKPTLAPVPLNLSDLAMSDYKIYARYMPIRISLEALSSLTSTFSQWLKPEVGPLLLLNTLAMSLLFNVPNRWEDLLQHGYFVLPKAGFETIITPRIQEAIEYVKDIIPASNLPQSGQELLERLESSEGAFWPLKAKTPIYRWQDVIYLDLRAASAQLDYYLEYPRLTGEVANIRAMHFELAVQVEIDNSLWNPPPAIKSVRGLTLRQNDRPLTDIDAIGAKDATLLLVSCKSIIYSHLYDGGDYQTVRNAAATIDGAVARWDGIRSQLMENPKGNNFDFSQYKEIISVVCTLGNVYSENSNTIRLIAPGLYAASSLPELISWLRGKTDLNVV